MSDFFTVLGALAPALHEIIVFSTATGISLGTLFLCALAFFYLPGLRKLAIGLALLTIWSYGLFIYAEHDGIRTEQAIWAASDAAQQKLEDERGDAIARAIEAKYSLQMIALQKKYTAALQQVDADEKKLASTGGSCPLGADALRLRNGSR